VPKAASGRAAVSLTRRGKSNDGKVATGIPGTSRARPGPSTTRSAGCANRSDPIARAGHGWPVLGHCLAHCGPGHGRPLSGQPRGFLPPCDGELLHLGQPPLLLGGIQPGNAIMVTEAKNVPTSGRFHLPCNPPIIPDRLERERLEQPARARLGNCAASCQRRARDSLKPRSCNVNGLTKPSAWRFDRRSPPRPSRSPVSAMRLSMRPPLRARHVGGAALDNLIARAGRGWAFFAHFLGYFGPGPFGFA
jgi:hypothetical protein